MFTFASTIYIHVLFIRTKTRIESVYMISEFFYISALFCFSLYFFYPQDDVAVTQYITAIRKEVTMDVESPLISQLDEYDKISPEPHNTNEPFRSARESVNHAFRKVVENALSSMDTLVSTLSYKEEQDVAAPLLVK